MLNAQVEVDDEVTAPVTRVMLQPGTETEQEVEETMSNSFVEIAQAPAELAKRRCESVLTSVGAGLHSALSAAGAVQSAADAVESLLPKGETAAEWKRVSVEASNLQNMIREMQEASNRLDELVYSAIVDANTEHVKVAADEVGVVIEDDELVRAVQCACRYSHVISVNSWKDFISLTPSNREIVYVSVEQGRRLSSASDSPAMKRFSELWTSPPPVRN